MKDEMRLREGEYRGCLTGGSMSERMNIVLLLSETCDKWKGG